METSSLQDITANAILKQKDDQQLKELKKKLDLKNKIVDKLSNVSLSMLQKTAAKGEYKHIVHTQYDDYDSQVCNDIRKIVDDLNKHNTYPTTLISGKQTGVYERCCDPYYDDDDEDIGKPWTKCDVRFTWKKPDKKPTNWWG